MAGLADLFGESYDPKNDKPRAQHVPVKPKGELKPLDAAYYENMPVMDKVSNVGRTLGQAVGFSPTLSNRMGEDAKNLIGFVPAVGDALTAVEAKEALVAGDYRKAAMLAGLTVVGMVPGVGDVAAKAGREGLETVADTMAAATRPSIKAYHGSPHSFDRFDMSKIGTGEGAQAYGHGLYFAENEGVAKSYRDTLAGKAKWDEIGYSVDELLPMMGANTPELKKIMHPYVTRDLDRMIDFLDEEGGGLEAAKAIVSKSKYDPKFHDAIAERLAKAHAAKQGSMYEVDIAADPEHFLDWDKPLTEQPHVRRSLGLPELRSDMTNEEYNAALDALGLRPPSHVDDLSRMTGDDYVSALPKQHGGPAPEERLKKAGIPGIKYLDAGSRAPKTLFDGKPIQSNDYVAQAAADALDNYGSPEEAIKVLSQHPGYKDTNTKAVELLKSGRVTRTTPAGSSNYVVFDDKLINIVKKYGIPAALGAGLITEEMARQMQEQGLGET